MNKKINENENFKNTDEIEMKRNQTKRIRGYEKDRNLNKKCTEKKRTETEEM